MQILKQGRSDRAVKQRGFTCFFCGCVYLAEVGEFVLEPYTLSGTMYYELKCNCPQCGASNKDVLLEEQKED